MECIPLKTSLLQKQPQKADKKLQREIISLSQLGSVKKIRTAIFMTSMSDLRLCRLVVSFMSYCILFPFAFNGRRTRLHLSKSWFKSLAFKLAFTNQLAHTLYVDLTFIWLLWNGETWTNLGLHLVVLVAFTTCCFMAFILYIREPQEAAWVFNHCVEHFHSGTNSSGQRKTLQELMLLNLPAGQTFIALALVILASVEPKVPYSCFAILPNAGPMSLAFWCLTVVQVHALLVHSYAAFFSAFCQISFYNVMLRDLKEMKEKMQ